MNINVDCLYRWPFRFRKWSWEVGRRDRAAFWPRQGDTESSGSSWAQTTPSRTGDPTHPVTTSPDGGQILPTIPMDCFCVPFFHLSVLFLFFSMTLPLTTDTFMLFVLFSCLSLYVSHSFVLHFCHVHWLSSFYFETSDSNTAQARDLMCRRADFEDTVCYPYWKFM